jgi:isopentenyl diphosphate isomerase/L-lactate dehydrogenase-like FMN-dependent dehydrogenase
MTWYTTATRPIGDDLSRRRFLEFLAASPLLLTPPLSRSLLAQDGEPIASPNLALNVFDFEVAAQRTLPPAHYAYLATGVDSDVTLRANREGFERYQLRARRMIDVRTIDMSVTLFGTVWDSPIVLAPVSAQKAFHQDGEIAVSRAARAKKHLQILSTLSSSGVEDVIAARGQPVWYQLYPTDQWSVTRALVKRAESAGCTVLVLTLDLQGGSNRETQARGQRRDSRQCSACHVGGPLGSSLDNFNAMVARKPMFAGIDVSRVQTPQPLDMSWDFLTRLRDTTTMKIVVKGIVTSDDAALAVEHGADGLIVSNHGGRAEESGRATIDSLTEVVGGVAGRIPVLVDGGFRRGTDIFKALALGAQAVCIGRPYVWGLAAFGQPGVETVLEILRRELTAIMRQTGTVTLGGIRSQAVVELKR